MTDPNEYFDMSIAVATAVSNSCSQAMFAWADSSGDEKGEDELNRWQQPRGKRTVYQHAEALHCIRRDYLGPTPIFKDKQFDMMFRISKSRFQRLMEDIGNAGISYYLNTVDATGKVGASFEARLLLPLKTLAYGVPPHTFTDYFQMSKTMARDCCLTFDRTINSLYLYEYLRKPTTSDLKSIVKLHKEAHGVDGMFGSLDCSHTWWKNCPKAWQGSYKGKEKRPTIVMESICDYHVFFWHVSYGYAGTLNDKNILHLSPFTESLVDGSFKELEEEAGVVPYKILDKEFNKLFILVDGIYPRYSRFVRGFKEPTTERQKRYCGWQEGARKDIERAFGVLQAKFQYICRPMNLWDLKDIAARVGTCMILHNMCVSDRVMGGDVRAVYDPANNLEDVEDKEGVDVPEDRVEIQYKHSTPEERTEDGGLREFSKTGIANASSTVRKYILSQRRDEWKDLDDSDQWTELLNTLMDAMGTKKRKT